MQYLLHLECPPCYLIEFEFRVEQGLLSDLGYHQLRQKASDISLLMLVPEREPTGTRLISAVIIL